MKIIHVETRIESIFGVLDGDDIIQKQPLSLVANKLSAETFEAAFHQILEKKEELAKALEAQVKPSL